MLTERVLFTFPAEIQIVMDVDQATGAVAVVESLVVPDQMGEIKAGLHFETDSSADVIPSAVEWLEANEWPNPLRLSADGASL